jgi:hypothetical protein
MEQVSPASKTGFFFSAAQLAAEKSNKILDFA